MGPLKNLGVAHQNPKTITVFQEFSYSVVFRLLKNYVKKLSLVSKFLTLLIAMWID